MIDNCTAIILAGGQSKRMGEDKAALILAGDSLLNHVIKNLQPLFGIDCLMLSVRQARNNNNNNMQLLLPQLCDNNNKHSNARGPLLGIATALTQVNTDWVFVIACDMPFISATMVANMANKRADYDIVVPYANNTLQPLAAFYSKRCLALMQAQIIAGERSIKTLISKLNTLIIQEKECRHYDAELLSFMDIDTPQDMVNIIAISRLWQ